MLWMFVHISKNNLISNYLICGLCSMERQDWNWKRDNWELSSDRRGFSTWYPHERRTSIWSMMTLGRKLPFSSWVIVYHANIQQTKGPPERGSWRRASIKHRLLDTFYLLTIPPTPTITITTPTSTVAGGDCTTHLTLHWFEKPYLS